MKTCLKIAALQLGLIASAVAQQREPQLDIYYIDVEGGQSTLFVGPTGESLLVDTGNAGERDLNRILEVLASAGVERIDHMWTTHYHGDHVGTLLQLAEKVPIAHFYDHGDPHPGDRIINANFMTAYAELSQGKRTIVKPGDKLAMSGVDIVTVASHGAVIDSSLPEGGSQNPYCGTTARVDESRFFDPDNGASAGFVLRYGEFRTVDLGDLTINGELDLMCPVNRVGSVDLYLTSHHGLEQSGSRALVHALSPRVAVMNNGTRKGGSLLALQILHESPGLEDIWQLHWSHNATLDNVPGMFIANVDDAATVAGVLTAEPAGRGGRGAGPGGPPGAAPGGAPGAGPGRAGGPPGGAPGAGPGRAGGPPGAPPGGAPARGGGPGGFGGPGGPGGFGGFGGFGGGNHEPAYLIHVTARADGSFTVTNTRNGFSKTYDAR